MSKQSRTLLMQMYRAMRGRFGFLDWWPGDSPLEICVGAILTQNTNWSNVEKAIANIKSAGKLDLMKIHRCRHETLARIIKPAGYFNVKAKRLKNFITHVVKQNDGDLDAFLSRPVDVLREDLLAVNGIGRETADSIILYAAQKASFVIDTYTIRILSRHGIVNSSDDYDVVRDFLSSSLPQDIELWNDFHAQFVAVGKHYCKPRPACDGCPLEKFPLA